MQHLYPFRLNPLIRLACLLFVLLPKGPLSGQTVGTYLTYPGAGLEALTPAGGGIYYTLDYNSGEIYKIGPGTAVQVLATGLDGPAGGAMDANGNFYFSELNQGRIYKIMPNDSMHVFCDGLAAPAGMVLMPSGDSLYVATYSGDEVRKIALSDSTHHPFVSGNGLNGPDGIVLAPNNDLIVANFDHNRVYRITPGGSVSLFATLNGTPNSGYITRINQDYYITAFYGHQIWRLDSLGNSFVLAGTGSPGQTNGPAASAQFTNPNGIAANPTQDTLLIAQGSTSGELRWVSDLQLATSNQSIDLPLQASLEISPQPANSRARVKLGLPHPTSIKLELMDLQGRILENIYTGDISAGWYDFALDSVNNLPNGHYLVRFQSAGQSLTQKLLVQH